MTGVWEPLRLSLQVSLVATALAVAFGVPLAWALAKARFWGKDVVAAIVLLPMLLPPTVLGYYLLVAVGRRSLVGSFLENAFNFTFVFDWTGAVLASFVVSAPFLVRTAQAGFEAVDPVYEEAARTLGRSELSIFLRVALPLAWRSIVAGTAMALARALGEFGATLMIAGNLPGRTQTMSLAIYDAVQAGRLDDARILALALAFTTIGILVIVGLSTTRARS